MIGLWTQSGQAAVDVKVGCPHSQVRASLTELLRWVEGAILVKPLQTVSCCNHIKVLLQGNQPEDS